MPALTETQMAALEALCGAPVVRVDRVGRSGNNRVFRAETECGTVAVKTYHLSADDPRDRLGAETKALSFLAPHLAGAVPALKGADRAAGVSVSTWVEGAPIAEPDDGDIDAALAFVRALKALSGDATAQALPLAAEACLSGRELIRQLEARLARLQGAAERPAELDAFLGGDLAPALERFAHAAVSGCAAAGLSFEHDIRPDQRVLSPSDFGFHNALKRPGGEIVFVDFEYFGWDDPVRLVADFVLHPGMDLTEPQRHRFAAGAGAAFAGDETFVLRLRLLYPLVCLRWCLILLNEFLPERWARRAYAGVDADRPAVQRRQLDKARKMLARADWPFNEVFRD